MEKPFPPWKYWTMSSLRGTLKQVLDNLGEEVERNVRTIVTAHDCVEEVQELKLLIETDVAECALIINFAHGNLQEPRPSSRWTAAIKKSQFDILKGISKFLVTTSLKPDVKMTTACTGGKVTSSTSWKDIRKISNGQMRYKDWASSASFSLKCEKL